MISSDVSVKILNFPVISGDFGFVFSDELPPNLPRQGLHVDTRMVERRTSIPTPAPPSAGRHGHPANQGDLVMVEDHPLDKGQHELPSHPIIGAIVPSS